MALSNQDRVAISNATTIAVLNFIDRHIGEHETPRAQAAAIATLAENHDLYMAPKVQRRYQKVRHDKRSLQRFLLRIVSVNAKQGMKLYDLFSKGSAAPVSYTHLTLPTKRIV